MTVHLFHGDDAALLASAVVDLVHELVGDNDRSLMVDEFATDDYELAALVDAAQTPPFLTDRRVVVGRELQQFDAKHLEPLLSYLSSPLDSTDLVLGATTARPPKALLDAVKSAGGLVLSTAVSTKKKDRSAWVEQQVEDEGLRLDAAATTLVADWLGEDAGRLAGLLDTLSSTFGSGRTLRVDDVSPFLGEAGNVAPWDFTDAIDRGNTALAISLMHRMMQAGNRHPLQIMALLHTHYGRLLRLDGADARDPASVSALVGTKPGFPTQKVIELSRSLGSGAVKRAIELLAQADLDLRGYRDLPPALVMEVLVARLSRLGGTEPAAVRRRR